MSKYTTEVRYICESYAGVEESGEFPDVEDIIADAREQIFDFEYPIFDDEYKSVLESKILRHYYTREIGQETVGLWKLKLCTKLNDIMPYYNQLYRSELLEFNPLLDVDLKTQHIGSNAGKSSGLSEREDSSNSVNASKNNTSANTQTYDLFSDTPQGALNGVDDENYLSSAGKRIGENTGSVNINGNSASASKGNNSFNNNFTNTDQYLEHIQGKNGGENYAKKLMDFRKTFLNIDMLIIKDLSDLFMYLW